MKKLLGISVIAALAVLPMAGYAAVGEPVAGDPGATVTENAQMATNSPKYALATEHGTDGNLATAGYVKGAYNAAIKAVNKLSDDTDDAIEDINDSIGTLSNLDTTAKTNLVAAINEVRTAASNGSGAIETKLAAGSSGYDINAKSMQVQGDNVVTEAAAQTLTNKTIDADNNTISDLTTGNLKSGVLVDSTAGIAAASSASDTKLVSEKAVRNAIDSVSTTMGSDYAKKTGVTQTITNSTISGTVPVMATWDNTTATTVAIAASITGATYAEPTTPAPAPEPAP